jgi:hypothetical protein
MRRHATSDQIGAGRSRRMASRGVRIRSVSAGHAAGWRSRALPPPAGSSVAPVSALVDQDGLVKWPEGDEYDDAAAGGLFAYLVHRFLAVPDRATVDVFPRLASDALAFPDALERQLWAPPKCERVVELNGEGPLHPWSRPLRSVLWLGSTPRALRHRDTGINFQVCRQDLTMDGDAITHCLDHVYGLPGEILTLVGRPVDPPPLARWLRVKRSRVF